MKYDDIRIWKIDRHTCYLKLPYNQRDIMNKRKPMAHYCKDGRVKYLQYEVTSEEAQKLSNKKIQEVLNV